MSDYDSEMLRLLAEIEQEAIEEAIARGSELESEIESERDSESEEYESEDDDTVMNDKVEMVCSSKEEDCVIIFGFKYNKV